MNKIALITGGSRGLGRDMALNLAKNGNDIIFTYNSNKEAAEKTAEEIRKTGRKAEILQLDTGKISSFEVFISSLKTTLKDNFQTGKFDFLINNAGIALYAMISETKEDQFDQIIDIHFKGVFFLTQKCLPLLNDGGCIINVSSGLARFALPGYSVYGPTKAAIDAMTRYMAQELGERGIRVNSIAPGAIATDFGGGMVRDNREVNQMVRSSTALGRVGVAEDIGSVVAFLCSDGARWINGQRIEASGGMML